MRKIRDYEAAFYGVLFGIGVLCLWYFTSFVVEEKVIPTSADYVISGLITLLTTALGAAFGARHGSSVAFNFKQEEDKQAKEQIEINAIRAALYVLAKQRLAVLSFEAQLEESSEGGRRGWLTLPSIKMPDYSSLKIKIDSLYFLLEHKEYTPLLIDLSTEQECFEQLFNANAMRSDERDKIVAPLLMRLENEGRKITEEVCIQILGAQANLIKTTTGSIFTLVDKLKIDLKTKFEKLVEVAAEKYPKTYFLKNIDSY